jgi:hypothetical protein
VKTLRTFSILCPFHPFSKIGTTSFVLYSFFFFFFASGNNELKMKKIRV